ncbi:MAG TPA: NADH-quinone oxidoreductase subunit N [Acidimicrobiaceae bacterium]|nr:NADH-quinone oxidoreductase subunit N [Acidimicrobiaceae bacterium]
MLSLLAQVADFKAPHVDYHALAPEIVMAVGLCAVLLVDLFVPDHKRWITGTLTGFVLIGAFIPVATLAVVGDDMRALFDGRYIVDEFALALKGLFLLSAYVVVLMSSNEMEEGHYYQGEYYVLLLSSVLGMVMMASSRDLISVFVALEFLSIPAYMMAAWRKRDSKSNEAGVKYYLLGVFASAVLLYGMSLMYGLASSTRLTDVGQALTLEGDKVGMQVLAIVFVIVGFAFKVSAVPFHTWAPDTYQGAPTPVTAFLSVASKAAGFTGLLAMVYLAFPMAHDVYQPFMWVLAALTMTVGNLLALKQTNIVRMLAYSSVSQGGFILMPLAVAGTGEAAGPALKAVVVYLLIYAATNLGAFAVVIAVARKTRSGEISSFGGLFNYAPGLAVMMTIFLASLAGIPPLGGWYAKFGAFRAVVEAGGGWGYTIAIVGAINAVIATAYYITVMREMWMKPAPDGDETPVRVPSPIVVAIALCGIGTMVMGVLPGAVARFGDLADLTFAFGG